MAEPASLARLMAWLSPVFPTGGFAYSAGLESAVDDGLVTDAQRLAAWLSAIIESGSLWNDLVLLSATHRQLEPDHALGELAEALAVGAERHRETRDQGRAFLEAAGAWGDTGAQAPLPLPIAVGVASRHHQIALIETLVAFGQTVVSNQCQVAIRLSVCGQTGAAKTMASVEPILVETANRAAKVEIDDLGGCTFLADQACLRHETLETRLFLS